MAKQTFDPASILSDDEKGAIVNQRAKQWAAEAFSHQLNREALLEADPQADTSDIDAALATLSVAVERVVTKSEQLVVTKSEQLSAERVVVK